LKNSFEKMSCSVALALDVIGEWWTILILRDLMIFGGQRRFEQLKEGLGISRNILTERLRKLTQEGIVTKVPISEGARRMEYQLTDKGWDLMPVMLSLAQWYGKWRPDPERDNLRFLDKEHGEEIEKVCAYSKDGRRLNPNDIHPVPRTKEAAEYLQQYSNKISPQTTESD
jgi:DNA-binding HxlR family transcriptional regulator